jgi:hypothetical protein
VRHESAVIVRTFRAEPVVLVGATPGMKSPARAPIGRVGRLSDSKLKRLLALLTRLRASAARKPLFEKSNSITKKESGFLTYGDRH